MGFHTVTPGILERCFRGASVLKRFPPNNDNSNCLRTHLLFISFGFLFFCGWVYVQICVCLCVRACVEAETDVMLHHSPPYFSRQRLSVNLKLTISARGWPVSTPGIHLSPLSQCQGYRHAQLFYTGAEDPELRLLSLPGNGPHAVQQAVYSLSHLVSLGFLFPTMEKTSKQT